MSAIWGIFGKSVDVEKILNMRKTMEIFEFERIQEKRDSSFYMACGHQNFSVESTNNKSPIVDDGIYLNSDCILYNRKELLNELGISQQLSDDELMMKLYKKDGERFVEKIRGSFSIVIYDSFSKIILVYADHFSRRSILYSVQEGEFCYATIMQPILEYLGGNVALNDRLIVASYTDCTADSSKILGETVYENIYAVTAGQYLKYNIDTQSIEKIQYYNPLKKKIKVKHSREEWKDIFLDTFSKATRKFFITTGNTGIMLSGGLDSSAVAAMASPALKGTDQLLYSYTQVPGKDFNIKYNELDYNDETELVKLQEKFHGNLNCSFVDGGKDNVFSHLDEIVSFYSQPVKACINLTMNTAIFEKAKNDGCTLMLSGQNGNASISYGGILSYVYQKLSSFQVCEAYKEICHFCDFRKIGRKQFFKVFMKQFKKIKINPLALEEGFFAKEELLDKYSLFDYLCKLDEHEGDGLLDSDRQHRNFLYFPRMYQQMGYYDTYNSLKYGIISEDPTLTPELIELCLAMPMECYVHNGRERAVVRDFFKGLVPEAILENHLSRGNQSADFEFRLNRDWDEIKKQAYQYLNNQYLFEYLDKKKIEEFTERIKNNEKNIDRRDAAYLCVISALSSFLMEYHKYKRVK